MCANSSVVRIPRCQRGGPGSIPGWRIIDICIFGIYFCSSFSKLIVGGWVRIPYRLLHSFNLIKILFINYPVRDLNPQPPH